MVLNVLVEVLVEVLVVPDDVDVVVVVVVVLESGTVLVTKPPEFWATQQAEGRMGTVGTTGAGPADPPGLGRVPV